MKNTTCRLIQGLSAAIIINFMSFCTFAKQPAIALAIHGGAGTILKKNMTEEKEARYRQKLSEAAKAGYGVLEAGGASLDAVAAAIRILEDSPLFNAGKGAVYTYDGTHTLDASLMDGNTRNTGAVAGVMHIKNPIELARLVMDKSPHVLLAGQGAEEFALTQGMALVPNHSFATPHRYQALLKAKAKLNQQMGLGKDYQAAVHTLPLQYRYGTVGAVALDKAGNLAAGTSTGGMTAKRFGRIGDSPIVGAGTWADNQSCAVSATGHGEFFIRYQVAADICARVKYQQQSVQGAADTVIHQVLAPVGGTGGVVSVDSEGQIAISFNTQGMYRASISSTEPLKTGIYKAQ